MFWFNKEKEEKFVREYESGNYRMSSETHSHHELIETGNSFRREASFEGKFREEPIEKDDKYERLIAAKEPTSERSSRSVKLEPEPAESDPESILIAFRGPNGSRAQRRFKKSEQVGSLYCYIGTLKPAQLGISSSKSFEVLRIQPSEVIDKNSEFTLEMLFEGSSQELLHVRDA